MLSLISSLSLKLYLNSLVYDRDIFGSSLKVFGNPRQSSVIFGEFRKMLGNVRATFGRYEDMNFMFSWQEQYHTRSLWSLVRYCSCPSNIKFISSRHRVISSIYVMFTQ